MDKNSRHRKKYVLIGDGESLHLVKWVKQLVRYFDVYIISSTNIHEQIRQLLAEGKVFNLRLHLKPEGGNLKLLMNTLKIERILKSIQPDYVNPHYITGYGLIAALIKRFSGLQYVLVQSAWGSDILVSPFKNQLYRRITKFSLDSADLVTSDSVHMTQVIGSLSDTKTLTFAFGLEKLPELDLNEKNDYLFYSNRMLSDNYNIDEVLTFFHRIEKKQPKAELIVSHDGKNRQKLEKQAKELGLGDKTQFTGFITETEQIFYYRKARFFISIPASDATSVSLLEAMAFGCIPIVSDIPANREWITEHSNGIFYKRGITDLTDIENVLSRSNQIAGLNRDIICNRALFADNIKYFINQLNELNI